MFWGYSYLRVDSSLSANLNGWELAGQCNVTDWLDGASAGSWLKR
jgi:hypothetical protein